MREIFEEIIVNQPLDPMESARRNMRASLRKRFYEVASVGGEGEGGFPVLLDGKPVRTPARQLLTAPARALAQAIADEWQAQEDVIDPARMPLTRLANAAIDAVGAQAQAVTDEIARYLGSDLVVYRASTPSGLVARQSELWDPVLAFARDDLGARFVQIEGVMFSAQPPQAIAAARAHIPVDAWPLAAMSLVTTLTGSALLALMLARGATTADAAWAAAHVDEDWQMAQWGRDEPALERRAFRRADFDAAAAVLALTV